MKRPLAASVLAAIVIGVPGCQENSPTSVDPGTFPAEIETFEIDLPWEVFGDGLQVLGGFGSPANLAGSIVAHEFRGSLESRVLVEVERFPAEVRVRNAEGLLVSDRNIVFESGRVVARIDTLSLAGEEGQNLTFQLGALDQEWDATSATWTLAADTFGVEVPWTEPGAGPLGQTVEGTWDAESEEDSVVFELPESVLTAWSDSLATRGFRLDLLTPDQRARITGIQVRLEIRPSIRPDTVVSSTVDARSRTFIYDPGPMPTGDAIVVGGAPAFRSVVGLSMPTELDGPAELCALVGCPYRIAPGDLNLASLILTSRASQPPGFQPVDSVFLDARPVLARDELPKSPLGPSLVGALIFGPEAFGEDAGQKMEVPITGLIRNLVDPETRASTPTGIALLALPEPGDLSFAEFDGPGDPAPPILRLLITVTDTVRFR